MSRALLLLLLLLPEAVLSAGLPVKIEKIRFSQIAGEAPSASLPDGSRLFLTLDPSIHRAVEKFFASERVAYGSFVALEPRSGRLLAMVEYQRGKRRTRQGSIALRSTFPAASIFKLVTAAALLEEGKISPEEVINFHGGLWRLGPRNWVDDPKRDRETITFAEALAKSANAPFAKAALKNLDRATLMRYADRFYFNQPIPFDLPVQISRARMDRTTEALARTAAGFGAVGLSPLHAALIGSAIGNDGAMARPVLVDRVVSPAGELIYSATPEILATVVSAETSRRLREMMAQTVLFGTSSRFFDPAGFPSLKNIPIGGKTGSLTGSDPPGKVSWFVGLAPIDRPEIAVAALVVNDPTRRRVHATEAATVGLAAYFARPGD